MFRALSVQRMLKRHISAADQRRPQMNASLSSARMAATSITSYNHRASITPTGISDMKFQLPVILLLLAIAAARIPQSAQAQQRVRFDQDVRPILSNHCWSCHGPDEVARQAGLRLDLQDSATAAADSGRIAIVPGKPAESELIARINAHDADAQMPPASAKKPITDRQKTCTSAVDRARGRVHFALGLHCPPAS